MKAAMNAIRIGQGGWWSCRCNTMLTGRVMTRQLGLGETIQFAAPWTQCFVGYDGEYWKEVWLRWVVVLQTQPVLDQGVPLNGRLVLWMREGVNCEVQPSSGCVVHWVWYQG